MLFTALIFTILWLLQTVFLQSFYNRMLINNTVSAAEKIIDNSTREDINDIIDELTHDNSLLVFITDEDGNLLYSSDEFKGIHSKLKSESMNKPDRKDNSENSSTPPDNKNFRMERRGNYDSLPMIYDTFLETLKSSGKDNNEYYSDSLYIYGSYIDYCGEDGKSVLYVSATIDTLGSSVTIIRMQLLWVTLLSLFVGFILSWFIARRFSRPLDSLSEKAKKLGGEEYEPDFKKGFCMELDELSDTLDKTNTKLKESRDFQIELLANVSHDLRTPVTMIKGYAEMIRDISWEDEKQCGEDIAVIVKEADRLTALVNEIMAYSELKSTDSIDELTEIDLSRLVQKAADRFETLNKPEGITVEKNIEEKIVIKGSSGHLERALYNLMDNAFRHTNESKKICVTLKHETDSAVIEVHDFGEGIPETEIEHIWDRYYTSRMRKGHGVSGLGLAIVKQVTQLHGGECYVKTEQGKGSSFFIRIKTEQ